MDKNADFSIQDAMKLAQTPAGQQLINMLRQQDSPELRTAIDRAASGDYASAKNALSALLDNPEIKNLLGQLGR